MASERWMNLQELTIREMQRYDIECRLGFESESEMFNIPDFLNQLMNIMKENEYLKSRNKILEATVESMRLDHAEDYKKVQDNYEHLINKILEQNPELLDVLMNENREEL